MTISTEVRKAGPFIGNDSASVFPFAFKVFKAADLIVVRRQDNIGEETTLILDSDYHVTLNSNQDTTPGGVVTLVAGALASGFTLVVSSELPYLQPTDLTNQGGFYPKVITNAMDRLTIFCQQLAEITGRTLKLPITAPANISTEIPLPNPAELIAWNETGTGLTTVSPQSLVTSIAYGSATADLFAGDGATTTFPLSTNPASVNNLDVSIGGHSQRPVQGGVGDYSWNGGASITFVVPPPAPTVPGDKNVLVRYMQAIPVSDSEALHAQTREALRRGYAEAGYNLVAGSFETGGVLASVADVLLQESTGAAYAWAGTLPKAVAPGFDPVGAGGFELRTDVVLRGRLASRDGEKLVGCCRNIEELRSTEPSFDGQKISVIGYYSDTPLVGGGDFVYSASSALADNGVTVFVTTGGKRWLRRNLPVKLPITYAGARTDSADNSTSINAALSVHNHVIVPSGVWNASNLKPKPESVIEGCGYSSIISGVAGVAAPTIVIGDGASGYNFNRIFNIRVNNQDNPTQPCVRAVKFNYLSLEYFSGESGSYGIVADTFEGLDICHSNLALNTNDGLRCDRTLDGELNSWVSVSDSFLNGNGANGYRLYDCASAIFSNTKVLNNKDRGGYAGVSAGKIATKRVTFFVMDKGDIDSNHNASLVIENYYNWHVDKTWVSGGRTSSQSSLNPSGFGILVVNSKFGGVSSSDCYACGNQGMRFIGCDQVTVDAGSIIGCGNTSGLYAESERVTIRDTAFEASGGSGFTQQAPFDIATGDSHCVITQNIAAHSVKGNLSGVNSIRITSDDPINIKPFRGPLPEYADDSSAAAAGVKIGGNYRTGNIVKQRIV